MFRGLLRRVFGIQWWVRIFNHHRDYTLTWGRHTWRASWQYRPETPDERAIKIINGVIAGLE